MKSMRCTLLILVAIVACPPTNARTATGTPPDSVKVYHVNRLVDTTTFNYATPSEQGLWNEAEATTDFTYPWRSDTPSPTTFRALHDDTYFYFLYEVIDTSRHVSTETGQETDVMDSDRVELFFLSNGTMNPYYCLEIDPNALVFDYESRFYRQTNEPWTWPADQISVKALPYEGGYAIAGRITLSSLRALGALQNDEMQVGLFRANVVGITPEGPDFRWISWVTPQAPEPDFHIPSAFGTFVLAP